MASSSTTTTTKLDRVKPDKSGCAQSFKIFDDFPEFLDDVVRYLFEQGDVKSDDVDLSNKGVLGIVKNLSRINEQLNISKPKAPQPSRVRLPIRFFHDVSFGGCLCQILHIALLCKQELNLRRIEFSERSLDHMEELMTRIESHLTTCGLFHRPIVFVSPLVPANVATHVKATVQSKRGTITLTPAAATHIVVPDPSSLLKSDEPVTAPSTEDNEEADVFLRPVKVVGAHCRAHFWYYPDSYDVWLPLAHFDHGGENEASGLPQPIDSTQPFRDQRIEPTQSAVVVHGKRRKGSNSVVLAGSAGFSTAIEVTTRWVSDLSKFNEWMNEDDYLVEMPVVDQSFSDTVIAIAVDAPATMQKPSRAAKLETNESAVRSPPQGSLKIHISLKKGIVISKSGGPKVYSVAQVSAFVNSDPTSLGGITHLQLRRVVRATSSAVTIEEADSDAEMDLHRPVIACTIVEWRAQLTVTGAKRRFSPSSVVGDSVEAAPLSRKAQAAPAHARMLVTGKHCVGPIGFKQLKRSLAGGIGGKSGATHIHGQSKPLRIPKKTSTSAARILNTAERLFHGSSIPTSVGPISVGPTSTVALPGSAMHVIPPRLVSSTRITVKDTRGVRKLNAARGRLAAEDGLALQASTRLSNISQPALCDLAPDTLPFAADIMITTRGVAAEPCYPTLLPSYAAWFDLASINAVERRALPEYFAPEAGDDVAASKQISGNDKSTIDCASHTSYLEELNMDGMPVADLSMSAGDIAILRRERAYLAVRNTIVLAYRAKPRHTLTVSASRLLVEGDGNALVRLHSFLTSWGLINYTLDYGTAYPPILSASKTQFPAAGSAPAWMFTHQPYASVTPFETQSACSIQTPALQQSALLNAMLTTNRSLAYRRAVFNAPQATTDLSATPELYLAPSLHSTDSGLTGVTRPVCRQCDLLVDSLRYTCKRDPSHHLCSKCFASGKFSSQLCSADFVRFGTPIGGRVSCGSGGSTGALDDGDDYELEQTAMASTGGAGVDPENWSPSETLRLLEALEQNGDDWIAACRHVGTKSIDACVLHFMQMPIEDPYLDQTAALLAPKSEDVACVAPFADHLNPVMSTIAFLSAHISPAVAAAASASVLREVGDPSIAFKESDIANSSSQMDVESTSNSSLHPTRPLLPELNLPALALQCCTDAALSARELAIEEDRKMILAVTTLTKLQMKKIELKMQFYETLDEAMIGERERLEQQRQKTYDERLRLRALYGNVRADSEMIPTSVSSIVGNNLSTESHNSTGLLK